MAHIESQGRSPYTLWRYRTAIHAHLRPALGHIDVTKLRASEIDACYAGLIAEGLNPLTVRTHHAILPASLRQGVKWGWIDRSPIERASPPSVLYREIVPPSVDAIVTDKSFVRSQSPDFSEPYRPTRVSATFRDLRDSTGLTHVSFHALRHFAATVLAGKGVAVRTIAGRLGHANPSVTLKTYAHFLEAAEK